MRVARAWRQPLGARCQKREKIKALGPGRQTPGKGEALGAKKPQKGEALSPGCHTQGNGVSVSVSLILTHASSGNAKRFPGV
jgi:hypothetical protein